MTDPTPDVPLPQDSVGDFVRDFAALKGDRTYEALAHQAKVSRGAVHQAMSKRHLLPSEYIVRKVVEELDSSSISQWLDRRAQLDPRQLRPAVTADEPPTTSRTPLIVSSLSVHRDRRRQRGIAAGLLLVGLFAGLGLGVPREVGGFDAVAYCQARSQTPNFVHGDAYDTLRCGQAGGVSDPLDAQAACRYDHPAWGVFGGAQYAGHTGSGWADWRCYGSWVHPLS